MPFSVHLHLVPSLEGGAENPPEDSCNPSTLGAESKGLNRNVPGKEAMETVPVACGRTMESGRLSLSDKLKSEKSTNRTTERVVYLYSPRASFRPSGPVGDDRGGNGDQMKSTCTGP